MGSTTFGSELSLTPSQEGLLRTALSSNNVSSNGPQKPFAGSLSNGGSYSNSKQQSGDSTGTGANVYTSPIQKTPGSGQLDNFDESPFLDYENLDDGNFDWDNNGEQLFGDLPENEFNDDVELHDKRKASDGQDDDDEASSKRREGEDKSGKKTAQKPGRKPLTGEPTTKRKAQNRAAQRAFRERKERHLKDLETKVEDLEKASETANHENGRLRATVDKLQMELKEYRKRLSMNVSGASYSPPQSATQSRSYSNSGNDFSFAFPKFGDLPGSYLNNGSLVKTTSPPQNGQRSASASNASIQSTLRKDSSSSSITKSPTNLNGIPSVTDPKPYQAPLTNGQNSGGYTDLSGLFSPSIFEFANRSNSTDYLSYPSSKATPTNGTNKQDSTSSVNEQNQAPSMRQTSLASLTGSPASSMSQAFDSSCGTTPESSAESPDNRKGSESVLNTINEETKAYNQTAVTSNMIRSPVADVNGFDWMAQQNGGQFDPVLFGDYRDPQDNIVNSFGDYFNDAFPNNDFASPYNTGDMISQPPRKDFIKEIEVPNQRIPNGTVPSPEERKFLGCDKLWDRVQSSEKAQSGEVDMDDLCSQLKSKAKCSGKGAVIDQKDVDAILGPAPTEGTDYSKIFS